MEFTSLTFLFFIILFFFSYQIIKDEYKKVLCLVSSYIFYATWDWRFLFLLILSSLIDFFISLKIEKSEDKKFLVSLSVILNLLILGVFKYFNFFSESFSKLLTIFSLNYDPIYLSIILPLAISFYTFQSMGYTIDVYKGKLKPEKNFLTFLTFISFFPQLIAGPIMRGKKMLPQIESLTKIKAANLILGLELIIIGFFLKLCIADRIGIYVEEPFNNPQNFGGAVLLISSFFFSFQIYADFGGYSLIAIGLARVIGIKLIKNFTQPYFAHSMRSFWTKWHISLSGWLKDYLYIPLGGNKKGKLSTFRNIMIVMILGGLWHGASVNFIIWGFFHSFLIITENIIRPKKPFPVSISIFYVFSMTSLAWIFFRAKDLDTAYIFFTKIFSIDSYWLNFSFDLFNFLISSIFICIFIILDIFEVKKNKLKKKTRTFLRIIQITILLWLISFLGVFKGSNFIYFQF